VCWDLALVVALQLHYSGGFLVEVSHDLCAVEYKSKYQVGRYRSRFVKLQSVRIELSRSLGFEIAPFR
jgi:hypothetical protein